MQELTMSAVRPVVLVLPFLGLVHSQEYQSDMDELYNKLLRNYNKNIRPVKSFFKTLNIHANMKLSQIIRLDGKDEVLTFTAQVEAVWKDEFITWNTSEHNGIHGFVMPADKVWTPDLNIANSAGSVRELSWFEHIYVFILSPGLVHFKIRSDFSVTCGLDMTYFPFDKQTCFADVAMQEFATQQVNLTGGGIHHIMTNEYQENGEWDLLDTSVESREYQFENKVVPFPYVRFSMHLKRKPLFYVLNIILPCVMLSILQLMVFLVPPSAGEKVSLGVTVLLSFTVFLLMVSDNMPQTSLYIPLLGVYLICILATSMLSLMVTIVGLRLHHHPPSDPVPHWLKVTVRLMAAVTCQSTSLVALNSRLVKMDSQEHQGNKEKHQNKSDRSHDEKMVSDVIKNGNLDQKTADYQPEVNTNMETGSGPWQLAAVIFDRFFALLFLFVIIAFNIVLIGIMPLFA